MNLLYNQKIVNEKDGVFRNNRAFRFGDACFETIRIYNGKPLFWNDHQMRLIRTLNALRMKVPEEFQDVRFFEMIIELCQKNEITSNGRVRITVFRNGAGLYKPVDNSVSYLGEVSPLDHDGYLLNKEGLKVSFYNDIPKPHSLLSGLKTTNCLLQIVAADHSASNGFDDYLLCNASGDIAEAISSNVFVYKEGMFFTPAVDEGCIPGIMRLQIMRILAEEGVFVLEGCVTKQMVLEADEVFLTNVIRGVQWINSCGEKKYSNTIATELKDRLNELIKQ